MVFVWGARVARGHGAFLGAILGRWVVCPERYVWNVGTFSAFGAKVVLRGSRLSWVDRSCAHLPCSIWGAHLTRGNGPFLGAILDAEHGAAADHRRDSEHGLELEHGPESEHRHAPGHGFDSDHRFASKHRLDSDHTLPCELTRKGRHGGGPSRLMPESLHHLEGCALGSSAKFRGSVVRSATPPRPPISMLRSEKTRIRVVQSIRAFAATTRGATLRSGGRGGPASATTSHQPP